MVLGFHIGTDGGDQATAFRGPGGAVLNYVETTYGGQYAAMKLVTGGALDRHPDLKVLDLRGRRDLGAVHRRPDERGLPPARHVRAAAAVDACPRRSSTARSTRRSSTTSRRPPRCGRWATRT